MYNNEDGCLSSLSLFYSRMVMLVFSLFVLDQDVYARLDNYSQNNISEPTHGMQFYHIIMLKYFVVIMIKL